MVLEAVLQSRRGKVILYLQRAVDVCPRCAFLVEAGGRLIPSRESYSSAEPARLISNSLPGFQNLRAAELQSRSPILCESELLRGPRGGSRVTGSGETPGPNSP
jgi:hypothetical protein